MKALLLIDIQNDFLPGGSLAVPRGDEIVPLVNRLQQQFELVVATQDWHPPLHKSFASSHHNKKKFDTIQWMGGEQVLWPDHCVQGTQGADFSALLDTKKVAAVFRKGMSPEIDSYSGFYDNGHLKSTGLSFYLKGLNVTELYLAGLAGDFCVYFTAKDALSEGFKVFLLEDVTRAITADRFEKAKHDLTSAGASVLSSHSLLLQQPFASLP